jgi:hypothetical protein
MITFNAFNRRRHLFLDFMTTSSITYARTTG